MRLFVKPWHRVSSLVCCVLVTAATLAWICKRNPNINFLPANAQAKWIVFPLGIDGHARPAVELDAIFRRVFPLRNTPSNASLMVRAARRVQLKINGNEVEVAQPPSWKNISTIEVAPLLRAGTNTIEARVFNDNAPPALWLALRTDELTLRSDDSWEGSLTGSAWRPAVLAARTRFPGTGNAYAGGEQTLSALRKIWPAWICFGLIAAAISLVLDRWTNCWRKTASEMRGWKVAALLAAVATLWVLLFCNNATLLSPHTGFDAQPHLDYIKYIQERRALPLPNEGYSMFHPPLYYIVAASTLSAFGLSVTNGVVLLRFLSMLFAIAQFTLVFFSARLLFPRRFDLRVLALLIAAFLPMQLYLSHYVTNETLAATLVTAALYLGLRLLFSENPSRFEYAGVGAALGAALLTKATAILLVPPLFIALGAQLLTQRSTVGKWLRTFGLMVAVCLAVSGWHYIRVWKHFGQPFVGNWNAAVGSPWWQDPGYHVVADYFRFGRSLVSPLFSGFAGIPDGMYSTLWGDALCGGWDIALRPPWNYDLMSGGYLLALVPTVFIVIGISVAVWRFVANPSAPAFLLLGFSAAMIVGVVLITLRVPSYAQVKSFYALSAVIPLCFFAALGFQVIGNRSAWLRITLATLIITSALNSFAAFWIVPSAARHVYAGQHFRLQQRPDAALSKAAQAIDRDPASASGHLLRAAVLDDQGRSNEALKEAERAAELNPGDSESYRQLAAILARGAQWDHAVREARRAVDLGPQNSVAYSVLLTALVNSNQMAAAVDVARDALALVPHSPDLHYILGLTLAAQKQYVPASNQFSYALQLRPGWAEARAKLEWVRLESTRASDSMDEQ